MPWAPSIYILSMSEIINHYTSILQSTTGRNNNLKNIKKKKLYTRSGTFSLDAPLPLKSDTVLHEWGPRFNALAWEIPSMGLLNFLANIWVKEHFSKIVIIVSMDESHCKTLSNKLSTVMDGWKL